MRIIVKKELDRINSLSAEQFVAEFHGTKNDIRLRKTMFQGQLSLMRGGLNASALTSQLIDNIKFAVEQLLPIPKVSRYQIFAPSPDIDYRVSGWNVSCVRYQCGVISPSGKFYRASLINPQASRFEP